jgi:hypothetical protein
MKRSTRLGLVTVIGLSAAVAGAATLPRALSPAAGGLWELSTRADGHGATRMCVRSPELLAQYEHRQRRCERTVVSDRGAEAIISYTCAEGGFGRSQVTLLTPRTLRIDTQGISNNLPFHYQLHARRIGDCRAR